MKKIIFIILLFPVLLFQCKSSKTPSMIPKSEGVKFIKSETLTSVIEQAEAEGKIVFVDFYTTWCAPCKMMDKDVFPDKDIARFFNENFINYKVDAEKGNGRNLAALYQVKAFPTLVWLDHKGRVLERAEGAAYHTELMRLAENALLNSGQ